MSIDKLFLEDNPASIVFDPVPSYSGDWIFSLDRLFKNAKREGQNNLFDEFFSKTYKEPLLKIFKNSAVLDLKVGMVSTPNENNIGRCLKYSKVDFFVGIISNCLNQNIDRYGLSALENDNRIKELIKYFKQDNETLNIAFSELLKEKMRKLKDILDKEFNSEYFEAAMLDYAPHKNRMSFHDFIKNFYQNVSDVQVGLLKLGDFFDKKQDYNELYKAFDPDIFFLLFAKIIYEFNVLRDKHEGVLDNSYSYLYRYKMALDKMVVEDKKYDPRLVSEKGIRYSRWQFKEDFITLMEKHPEAKSFKLPSIEGNPDKYKDIKLMEKIVTLYDEETKVNWEFLPDGEGIKRGVTRHREVEELDSREKEKLINEVNMRISILEDSGFVGRPIKGLNTFTGYYAFVYPNGKVILEKFWQHEENMTPAKGEATYVMTIDNFIEMSKLSKLNLIEYIKTLPEIGVKRIFHTTINNWQRNLYNEIQGTYRFDDAINFVSGLKLGEVNNAK